MSTIVTRSGKGSALSFTEMDNNFSNLNTDKLENITGENLTDLSDVVITGTPADNELLAYDTSTSKFINQTAVEAGLASLTSFSVGAEAAASGDGAIAYNNSSGVFTYTPPTAAGIGAIALTALSVGAEGAASGDGSIAYNNTTGVFTYTPPTAAGIGAATSAQGSTADSALQNVSEDTTPQLGGALDLNSNNITGTGNIDTTGTLSLTNTTTGDSLTIATTEDSSTAAPVICLKRNSGSPSDGDYLGQLKFLGENDADQQVVYAKITAKTSDVTDTTEDGLIEFALRKAGSNNIGMRLTSTDLKLINGTGLELGGDLDVLTNNITTSTTNGNLTLEANGTGSLVVNAGVGINLKTAANIFTDATNQDIDISPSGTGLINLNSLTAFGSGIEETIHTSTTTTGTYAPAASNGSIHYVAMTGSMTINGFTNVAAGQTISLFFDGTGGAYTLTLGASILTPGGSLALTSGGYDIVTITCIDDTTPIYVATAINNFQ